MAAKLPALLSKEQRESLNQSAKKWFGDELNIELGQFEVDAVVDYFIEELESPLHNQGVREALATVREYHARIEDDLYALEQPEKA